MLIFFSKMHDCWLTLNSTGHSLLPTFNSLNCLFLLEGRLDKDDGIVVDDLPQKNRDTNCGIYNSGKDKALQYRNNVT